MLDMIDMSIDTVLFIITITITTSMIRIIIVSIVVIVIVIVLSQVEMAEVGCKYHFFFLSVVINMITNVIACFYYYCVKINSIVGSC